MKKIIIIAPFFSCSGYGEMSRFALDVLKHHQDKYDIYIQVINWGQTSWLHEETEEYLFIKSLKEKTEVYLKDKEQKKQQAGFDISLQITIPNEWKKLAEINIGYTAGIETTHISPSWLQPCDSMDKIITISEFAKEIFLGTVFQDGAGNERRIKTPISVVHFPHKKLENKQLNLDISTDFNFLTVNQWGPRKNIEQLITTFIEEFRNENVGLVIKTNKSSDSVIDREFTSNELKNLIASRGEKNCKVYLIHGRLSEEEINSLYLHPKIKAFVTSTHGEGFGMPIYEATLAGLPVIATDWSGHLDFLSIDDKKMFAKVDYELRQIDQQHVWPGVMENGVGWAYPSQNSLKSRMREVYKDYGRFKSWANKLNEHNKNKFTKQKIYDKFIDIINGEIDGIVVL